MASLVVKMGRNEPAFSMDPSGKLVYMQNTDVLYASLSQADTGPFTAHDGQRLPLSACGLGTTELYVGALAHSPNGWFITIVGDGEYINYTALA